MSTGQPSSGPEGPRVYSKERAVYVISVAADLAGVHPQTLRIYERKGLLSPKRTAGNTRRYSEQDVEQLRQIQRLTQDEGVNLAGVRIIMEMQAQLAELQDQLERTRRRLAEEAQAQAEEARRQAQKLAERQAERQAEWRGEWRGGELGNYPAQRRPHWGVLARLDDVRTIYGPSKGTPQPGPQAAPPPGSHMSRGG